MAPFSAVEAPAFLQAPPPLCRSQASSSQLHGFLGVEYIVLWRRGPRSGMGDGRFRDERRGGVERSSPTSLLSLSPSFLNSVI